MFNNTSLMIGRHFGSNHFVFLWIFEDNLSVRKKMLLKIIYCLNQLDLEDIEIKGL